MKPLWIIFLVFLMGCGKGVAPPVASSAAAATEPEPEPEPLVNKNKPSQETNETTWYHDKVIVLTYHHIDQETKSPYTITPELFREHMEFLKKIIISTPSN
jgi:hypothetical protein